MKLFSKLILITVFLVIYGNSDEINTKIPSKKELIKIADTGNIEAMVKLHKFYSFPETKEGLAYYKKWYPNIEKNKDAKKIIKFAKVFNKYRDMFVNGDEKYEKLLNIAKQKGNEEALFLLFNYYHKYNRKIREIYYELKNYITYCCYREEVNDDVINDMKDNFANQEIKGIKYLKLKNQLLNSSKETMAKFYLLAVNLHEWTLAQKIRSIMVKKAYIKSNEKNIKELNKNINKSKKALEKTIDKILETNLEADIIYASRLYNSFNFRYKEYKKLTKKLYLKALEFEMDKKLRSDTYLHLGDIYYSYSNFRKKEESYRYYYKAVTLGNMNAVSEIYDIIGHVNYIHYNDKAKRYTDLYKKIPKIDKYNDKLDILAGNFNYENKYKTADYLASIGNKQSIQKLAFYSLRYKIDSDEFKKISRKWKEYLLKSNDSELFKLVINDNEYEYFDGIKELKEKLIDKSIKSKNIVMQRAVLHKKLEKYIKYKYKYNENVKIEKSMKFLELLHSWGDVKSSLLLAKYLLKDDFKGTKEKSIKKALKILKELAKQNDKKAMGILGDFYQKNTKYKDIKKAAKYYEKGSIESRIKLASIHFGDKYNYFLKHEKDKMIKNLEILIKAGKKEYAYKLGYLYLNEDVKKASHFLKIAGKDGKDNAYYFLAELNKKSNPKKAYEYLKKCTKIWGQNLNCDLLLAEFFKKGIVVAKDEMKAESYIISVRDQQGYYNSKEFLEGNDYKLIGQLKDAINSYLKSARRYNTKAINELSRIYSYSYNYEVSDEDKKYIKEKMNMIFDEYKFDYKIDKTYMGSLAAYCVGYIYEFGEFDIKIDIKKAIEYYKYSGIYEAQNRMKYLLKNEKNK